MVAKNKVSFIAKSIYLSGSKVTEEKYSTWKTSALNNNESKEPRNLNNEPNTPSVYVCSDLISKWLKLEYANSKITYENNWNSTRPIYR